MSLHVSHWLDRIVAFKPQWHIYRSFLPEECIVPHRPRTSIHNKMDTDEYSVLERRQATTPTESSGHKTPFDIENHMNPGMSPVHRSSFQIPSLTFPRQPPPHHRHPLPPRPLLPRPLPSSLDHPRHNHRHPPRAIRPLNRPRPPTRAICRRLAPHRYRTPHHDVPHPLQNTLRDPAHLAPLLRALETPPHLLRLQLDPLSVTDDGPRMGVSAG